MSSKLWSVKHVVQFAVRRQPENAAQGNTFIIWKEGVTKDFEDRLPFRCNASNNSGIQYRSRHITDGSGETTGSFADTSMNYAMN